MFFRLIYSYLLVDSGAGGVISNAVDMASWLQTLLSGGRNAATDEAVIPPEAINMVSSGVTIFESSPCVCLLVCQHPFLSAAVYGGGQAQIAYRGHASQSLQRLYYYDSTHTYHVCVGISVLTNDNELGSAISLAIKYRISDGALGLTPIDSKTM
ncbi:hypothetical protein BDN71DRAFT_1388755 [Pleurotus eryngii]|uniref:Uncharacterized protein n=1 Tax=Pleurotus eryngii TaxID=5323 RepID=A0A9P6A2W7_PLEER|nr:hypothetical protein BDN71DRAFT_1388755 [Pleurotus eryngii]